MANFASRRIFSRLFAFNELAHFTKQPRCSSAFLINSNNHSYEVQRKHLLKPQLFATYRIQQCLYSENEKKNEKLSLFKRFKLMYKDYWYVLVPVHIVTSAGWFGAFYYLAKSGVDIAGILESWSISEKITSPLKDSSMGYIAISYALYKIATPLRYTVTLGGTTVSINYLKKWGYIKPVPSKERLKEMYFEQKDNLMETVRETKEGLKVQSEKLKDKKDDLIEDLKKIKDISKSNKEHIIGEGNKKKEQKTKHKDE